MNDLLVWLKGQAVQPSTWRGLALVLTALGVTSEDDARAEQFGACVVALIGMWDVLRRGRTFGSPQA